MNIKNLLTSLVLSATIPAGLTLSNGTFAPKTFAMETSNDGNDTGDRDKRNKKDHDNPNSNSNSDVSNSKPVRKPVTSDLIKSESKLKTGSFIKPESKPLKKQRDNRKNGAKLTNNQNDSIDDTLYNGIQHINITTQNNGITSNTDESVSNVATYNSTSNQNNDINLNEPLQPLPVNNQNNGVNLNGALPNIIQPIVNNQNNDINLDEPLHVNDQNNDIDLNELLPDITQPFPVNDQNNDINLNEPLQPLPVNNQNNGVNLNGALPYLIQPLPVNDQNNGVNLNGALPYLIQPLVNDQNNGVNLNGALPYLIQPLVNDQNNGVNLNILYNFRINQARGIVEMRHNNLFLDFQSVDLSYLVNIDNLNHNSRILADVGLGGLVAALEYGVQLSYNGILRIMEENQNVIALLNQDLLRTIVFQIRMSGRPLNEQLVLCNCLLKYASTNI